MNDWLSLRQAAKVTGLPRGWIEIMCNKGTLRTRHNMAEQAEVLLTDVEEHKLFVQSLDTLHEKLYEILDGPSWTRYGDLRAAFPSNRAAELRDALTDLLDVDLIEEGTYTNRGKVGKQYRRVTNDVD